MIRHKNDTEGLLLSINKICDTPFEQTHRKAEEKMEFKLTKPRETFHSNQPLSIKGPWMVGLLSLEVYNSFFNTTQENNKFELYTDTFDDISFEEPKDELEEILIVLDIAPYHLQHEKKDHVLLKHIRN